MFFFVYTIVKLFLLQVQDDNDENKSVKDKPYMKIAIRDCRMYEPKTWTTCVQGNITFWNGVKITFQPDIPQCDHGDVKQHVKND